MKKNNQVYEALKYFGLNENYTEEELHQAYEKKRQEKLKKIIFSPIDDKLINECDYYLDILTVYKYKLHLADIIDNIILKDIDVDERKIFNLPINCAKFYLENPNRYNSIVSLFSQIKFIVEVFKVHFMKTSTIKETKDCYSFFINNISESLFEFEGSILNHEEKLTKDIYYSKANHSKNQNVISVKQVIINIYKHFTKIKNEEKNEEVAMIKNDETPIEKMKEYQNKKEIKDAKMSEYVRLVVDNLLSRTEEYSKASKYYQRMYSENDFDKFLELYNEAIEYLNSVIVNKNSKSK